MSPPLRRPQRPRARLFKVGAAAPPGRSLMSFTRATPAADPDLFQKYFPGETESDSGPDEDGLPARRQGLRRRRTHRSH